MLLEWLFKCKLSLKNSIKLIEKNKFAAARVKIFLVTRISWNKSIFLFGLRKNIQKTGVENGQFWENLLLNDPLLHMEEGLFC